LDMSRFYGSNALTRLTLVTFWLRLNRAEYFAL